MGKEDTETGKYIVNILLRSDSIEFSSIKMIFIYFTFYTKVFFLFIITLFQFCYF